MKQRTSLRLLLSQLHDEVDVRLHRIQLLFACNSRMIYFITNVCAHHEQLALTSISAPHTLRVPAHAYFKDHLVVGRRQQSVSRHVNLHSFTYLLLPMINYGRWRSIKIDARFVSARTNALFVAFLQFSLTRQDASFAFHSSTHSNKAPTWLTLSVPGVAWMLNGASMHTDSVLV